VTSLTDFAKKKKKTAQILIKNEQEGRRDAISDAVGVNGKKKKKTEKRERGSGKQGPCRGRRFQALFPRFQEGQMNKWLDRGHPQTPRTEHLEVRHFERR